MTLSAIIIALVLAGVALYLIQLIPMDNTIRTIIRVLVILVVVLYVLSGLGFITGVPLKLK